MRLASKYPTGTRDSVGHLFVNGGEVRTMLFFISILDKDMLFRVLLEMYRNSMEAKESPWKLARCLNDLDAKKKLIEDIKQVMVDFLPEYKGKDREIFFTSFYSVFDEVKEELIRQNPVEST